MGATLNRQAFFATYRAARQRAAGGRAPCRLPTAHALSEATEGVTEFHMERTLSGGDEGSAATMWTWVRDGRREGIVFAMDRARLTQVLAR